MSDWLDVGPGIKIDTGHCQSITKITAKKLQGNASFR